MAKTFPTDASVVALTEVASGDELVVFDASDSSEAKTLDVDNFIAPVASTGGGGMSLAVITAQTGGDNQVASDIHTVTLFNGYNTYVGVANNTTHTDSGFVAGTASHSIAGGYDCLVNGLASTVLSRHAYTSTASSHPTIIGGSWHEDTGGTYGAIIGGGAGSTATANRITAGAAGAIIGGQQNTLNSNRAVIIGGDTNDNQGGQAVILGGSDHTISAAGVQGVIAGGTNGDVTGGNAVIIGGANSTASGSGAVVAGGSGGIASGTNSICMGGSDNEVAAAGGVVLGGQGTNTVASTAAASFVLGRDCTAQGESNQYVIGYDGLGETAATLTHASQEIAAKGDAQTIRFTVRGQTGDATTTAIYAAGASDTRLSDFGSNWGVLRGQVHLTGMDTSNGNVVAFAPTNFVVTWAAGGATTVTYEDTWSEIVDEDTLSGTLPSIYVDGAGDFGINVTGKAATTINWVGTVTGVMTHA